MTRKTDASHPILGLLALRPMWRMYDVTQQMRRNMRFFWPRAASRIYAQAKRLVTRGFAASHAEAAGKRTRTIYSITDEGRRALAQWLATPPGATSLECEPLLRVMLGDFGRPQDVLVALDQARADGRAILEVGRVVGAEYLAGTAPFQDQVHVRAFVFDFLSHFGRFLIEWADRTEAVYAGWPEVSEADRAATACDLIARNLSEYPEDLRP